jgi:hypothetical protein
MKLPHEFCRLPVRFDARRLAEEVAALPAGAWAAHPTGYAGNSAVRLISQDGGENDEVAGAMQPTPWLARCPYLQQVLGSFGVVWSRSRLMKLAPGAQVPQHCDVSYHWTRRVRVHIPVLTFPEVRFYCGMKGVHMGAGEAWLFDNWRPHRVVNGSAHERIHLVADTQGNAQFWNMVGAGEWQGFERPSMAAVLPYRAISSPSPLTERHNRPVVMPPSEIEGIVADLINDLGTEQSTDTAKLALGQFKRCLRSFERNWREHWSLHADAMSGWRGYAELRKSAREQLAAIAVPVYVWSNQTLALQAVEAGLLGHVLNPPGVEATREDEYAHGPSPARAPAPKAAPASIDARLERPVFIVAAPRSGSTLLFETLGRASAFWTVGGEAHGLVEQFAELRPGAPGVDSNRLDASAASPVVIRGMRGYLASRLRNARGEPPAGTEAMRVLEKTPKNALRVPLLDAAFPDARFIFLWRDPQPNIASIIEAWQAGGWVTYPSLAGWEGPWSLLLPPDWQALRGKPLVEIAAFQWQASNEIALTDLQQLPKERWLAMSYQDFLADSAGSIARLCDFAGIEVDSGLRAHIAGGLPWSRHTQSPPDADKWRRHESAIEVLRSKFEPTWNRLRALSSQKH